MTHENMQPDTASPFPMPKEIRNKEDAARVYYATSERLQHPESLTPAEVFSHILTLHSATETENLESLGGRRNIYAFGLQALIRSNGFNPQEHGLFFTHLSQGLFEQERMIQEQQPLPIRLKR